MSRFSKIELDRHFILDPLLPFDPTEIFTTGIPFAFDDYLELIDTVGRAVHPKKRGFIPDNTPAILQRLNISTEAFIHNADQFLRRFGGAVGHPAKLIDLAAARNVRLKRPSCRISAPNKPSSTNYWTGTLYLLFAMG